MDVRQKAFEKDHSRRVTISKNEIAALIVVTTVHEIIYAASTRPELASQFRESHRLFINGMIPNSSTVKITATNATTAG
jgi:hypothetical protein